MGELGCK